MTKIKEPNKCNYYNPRMAYLSLNHNKLWLGRPINSLTKELPPSKYRNLIKNNGSNKTIIVDSNGVPTLVNYLPAGSVTELSQELIAVLKLIGQFHATNALSRVLKIKVFILMHLNYNNYTYSIDTLKDIITKRFKTTYNAIDCIINDLVRDNLVRISDKGLMLKRPINFNLDKIKNKDKGINQFKKYLLKRQK